MLKNLTASCPAISTVDFYVTLHHSGFHLPFSSLSPVCLHLHSLLSLHLKDNPRSLNSAPLHYLSSLRLHCSSRLPLASFNLRSPFFSRACVHLSTLFFTCSTSLVTDHHVICKHGGSSPDLICHAVRQHASK